MRWGSGRVCPPCPKTRPHRATTACDGFDDFRDRRVACRCLTDLVLIGEPVPEALLPTEVSQGSIVGVLGSSQGGVAQAGPVDGRRARLSEGHSSCGCLRRG